MFLTEILMRKIHPIQKKIGKLYILFINYLTQPNVHLYQQLIKTRIMKKLAITLGVALFTIVGVQAQKNMDVKKETVTKRVVTTDDYQTTVKVVEEIDQEVDVLDVPENGMEELSPNKISKSTDQINVLTDKTVVDTKKKMSDANAKAKTEASLKKELENSKMMQANKEKMKKAKYEANQKLLELERLERKAVLTKKIGQSADDAKMQSPEVQQARKDYEAALEKATKAESVMKKM